MSIDTRGEHIVVLSRFFSRNTYLVAGMCWKCYKDATDVRITGINGIFLKKAKKYEEYNDFLKDQSDLEDSMIILDDDQDAFLKKTNTEDIDIIKEENIEDYLINKQEIINKNIQEIIKYENVENLEGKSKFFKVDLKNSPIKAEFFKNFPKIENPKIPKLDFDFLNSSLKYKVKFVPPKSPYNLIEESLYHDPWALLVATIFLNRTKLKQSRAYIEWFLADFKNPHQVLRTEISNLEKYFVNLGLQRTRSMQVYRMSYDFLHKNWKNAEELYGIGQYGRDAFNMFCLGNFNVKPKDRYLRIYRDWYEVNFLKKNKDFDAEFLMASSQNDPEFNKSHTGGNGLDFGDLSSEDGGFNGEEASSSEEERLCVLGDVFEDFYMANRVFTESCFSEDISEDMEDSSDFVDGKESKDVEEDMSINEDVRRS